MSKRYVVPEGMRRAVCDACVKQLCQCTDFTVVLEAAIGWLAENPIVPTAKQTVTMMTDADPQVFGVDSVIRAAVEWQRRMFLAPEPNPAVEKAKNAVRGSTLTREEADEIINYVNMCSPS